jgi:hypothetical protein
MGKGVLNLRHLHLFLNSHATSLGILAIEIQWRGADGIAQPQLGASSTKLTDGSRHRGEHRFNWRIPGADKTAKDLDVVVST